jgi:Transcription factor WhiB
MWYICGWSGIQLMKGRTQPVRDLPLPLALPRILIDSGLCANHPDSHWWTSGRPTERKAAASACEKCPVLEACRTWALSVPSYATKGATYGGLTPGRRLALLKPEQATRRAEHAARRKRERRADAKREGMAAVNAAKETCDFGHDLAGENVKTYPRTGKPGSTRRVCVACVRRRSASARRLQRQLQRAA